MSPLPGPDDPGRLHPATLLLAPIRQLGAWAVPLVIALVAGSRSSEGLGGFGLVLLVLAVTFVGQLVRWLRLRWWVEDGAVHLRTGLLQVENRTVPIDRIHNVDVVEPLFARVLGMAELRIESAGSSGADLSLSYVAADAAQAIRDALTASAGASDELEEEPPETTVLVRTPTSELLVAGATSNRIGALAIAAGAVGFLIDSGIDPEGVLDSAWDLVLLAPWVAGISIAVAAVVIGWVVSIAQSVLRFNDFTLELVGDEAHRSHGLLTKSSGRIPLGRVQAVAVTQPLLRRWLGRSTIVAETAGSVAAGVDAGTGTVSPIEHDARVPELVSTMLRRAGTGNERLQPVSRLAIRRGFVRAWVPLAAIGVAGAIWLSTWWLGLPLGAAPLAWWWSHRRWVAIGYRLEDDLLVCRSGVLLRRRWFIPTAKVQAAGTRATPFQRRLGLADLLVESAAKGAATVRVIDVEADEADSLAERLSLVSADTAFRTDAV